MFSILITALFFVWAVVAVAASVYWLKLSIEASNKQPLVRK